MLKRLCIAIVCFLLFCFAVMPSSAQAAPPHTLLEVPFDSTEAEVTAMMKQRYGVKLVKPEMADDAHMLRTASPMLLYGYPVTVEFWFLEEEGAIGLYATRLRFCYDETSTVSAVTTRLYEAIGTLGKGFHIYNQIINSLQSKSKSLQSLESNQGSALIPNSFEVADSPDTSMQYDVPIKEGQLDTGFLLGNIERGKTYYVSTLVDNAEIKMQYGINELPDALFFGGCEIDVWYFDVPPTSDAFEAPEQPHCVYTAEAANLLLPSDIYVFN